MSDEDYWNSLLPVLMERVASAARKSSAGVASRHGLTSAHASHVAALRMRDGQTMGDLSRFLDLDPASTNRAVSALKEKGFAYDDRKTENGKKYSIFLTEAGMRLADEIAESNAAAMRSFFDGMPRDRVAALRNALAEAVQNTDPDIGRHIRFDPCDPHLVSGQARINRDFIATPDIGADGEDELN
ncbi:MAG: MarR family transcriptional regulator [Candidatus Methanoplasma sp.]|jgi:DNA-binding MarR family transcriptional regulator|nr:MarR family transcriptional regulator [Candidatus Methanoplasma sp.]